MELSEKIRILRKIKGWSQEELGFKLSKMNSTGISRQAISDWENGKTEPKLDNIRDLADILNVSYDVLLDESIDLNDKETMNSVFHESLITTKKKTVRSVIYYFSYFKLNWKFYLSIPLCLIGLAAFILFIYLYFKESQSWQLLLFIIFEFIFSFSLYYLIFQLCKISHKTGKRAGCLTYNHLRIEAHDNLGTTIYVPIFNIEYMKLQKHKHNFVGNILIKIKEKNEPIVLKNIYSPITLVNTYYQIIGPEKDLNQLDL